MNSQITVSKGFLQEFLQGCCLEIYSYTLLFHFFHFTVTWTLDFLLNKHKYIKRYQTSTILITQVHSRHHQLAASGIELITSDSTRWARLKGGHAVILSFIGATILLYLYFTQYLYFSLKNIYINFEFRFPEILWISLYFLISEINQNNFYLLGNRKVTRIKEIFYHY